MLRPRKTPLHNYARCAALHRQEACACGQEAANFATGKRKQDYLRYNTNTTEGIQMSLWRKHKYHQIFMGQPMRCSADEQQGLRLNFLLFKKNFIYISPIVRLQRKLVLSYFEDEIEVGVTCRSTFNSIAYLHLHEHTL